VNTMRAAVIRAYRDVVVETMPAPEVEPGGLLVRTAACGICSGDVMPWYIEKKAPLVLGHEPAGTVVAVGENAPFAVGDRVFAHHHAPCMKCDLCRRGLYVHCEVWKQPAITPGGCAEYFAVSANGARHDTLLIPDALPIEAGCLVEPLGCAVKGFRRLRAPEQLGVVLVLGLGPMGLLNIALARHHGASMIVAVDRVPYRLDLARRFGADATVDFSQNNVKTALLDIAGRSADLVIVGPPDVAAMETGVSCAAPGADVLLFSPVTPGQEFAYDPNRLYFDEVNLIPSYSCGPDDTRDALALLADGVIDIDALVSQRFPLDKVGQAYDLVAAGGDSAKVLVELGG